MKLPSRIVFAAIVLAFFIVVSLPLNYALSFALGVENATILVTAIYIILASIAFGWVFYKDFY
ncbi:MAG: hypothetical protein MPF33_01900 [Candidatus Aramenus sp.]|jgi:uncharacterized membrane protein YqjE|nr:hypothetical protein [Candidatus Aramenus sp.]